MKQNCMITGIRGFFSTYTRDEHYSIGPYSKLSLVNKLTIYKLFTRSALTYNIHLWYETSMTNRKRIQTYQNKIIRMCMNLRPDPISFRQVRNTTIHQICNISTVIEFYERIKDKSIEGCKNHRNETIKSFFPTPMLSYE